jgi:phage terminase small subunit
MNPRQQRFVDEYLKCRNAADAYRKAGYKCTGPHAASVGGARLLADAGILQEIERGLAKQREKIAVDADEILDEWKAIAFSDLADFFYRVDGQLKLKEIDEMEPRVRRAIASVKVKQITTGPDKGRVQVLEIRLWDKNSALVCLGKHKKLLNDTPDVNLDFSLTVNEVVVDGSSRGELPVVDVALPKEDDRPASSPEGLLPDAD